MTTRRRVALDLVVGFATVIAGALAMWMWTGDPVTAVTFELGVITGSYLTSMCVRRWSR